MTARVPNHVRWVQIVHVVNASRPIVPRGIRAALPLVAALASRHEAVWTCASVTRPGRLGMHKGLPLALSVHVVAVAHAVPAATRSLPRVPRQRPTLPLQARRRDERGLRRGRHEAARGGWRDVRWRQGH